MAFQIAGNPKIWLTYFSYKHYRDVIRSKMAFQTTSVSMVYSTVSSNADKRKLQSSASLAFVREIHQWAVNAPHIGPVTRKCFHLMTSSWSIWKLRITLCNSNPAGTYPCPKMDKYKETLPVYGLHVGRGAWILHGCFVNWLTQSSNTVVLRIKLVQGYM